ncbi:hypothetical protein DASC09_019290 [Saccharomycopsis crataegensis]|uniref:L-serine ammonia-lyase n=1 Tax=Saccharomycopsis crataegensis TaxID=43959 RepID=A0AAV5QJK7_9ASCO|nr:hypothetical protein DASC09_019290 [Saccharomycopsis crataegensis]
MTFRTPTNLPYVETPLVKSAELSKICDVYLKCEFTQPSGSFKSRGLGHLIQKSLEEAQSLNKKIHLFTSSGGNAGLAASTAGSFYNLPCTVVLPITTKLRMKEKIERTGAEVIIQGKHWGEADEFLRNEIIAKVDLNEIVPIYCHPFDHELIWEGHSTMIDEIVYQIPESKISKIKGIVCSVGGGGLYNGVVRGLIKNGLEIPVLAVETENAPTLHSAIEAGKVVYLSDVKTVATSLASPYISSKSLENSKAHPTHSILITDNNSLEGVVSFANHHNIIVEPACGASIFAADNLSLLEKAFGKLSKDDIVIVIACGGSATTYGDIVKYQKILIDEHK